MQEIVELHIHTHICIRHAGSQVVGKFAIAFVLICVAKCQRSQLLMLIMLYMKRKHLCAPHLAMQCSMPVQDIKGDRRVSERK